MDSKNKMTVGFIFNNDLSKVLLIKKNRPEWQDGFLNGVGGHMRPLEENRNDFEACWIREVKEETDLRIDKSNITRIGRIFSTNNGIIVVMYAYRLSKSEESTYKCEQMTDEEITWFNVDDLPKLKTIANLQHLIPLARYTFQQPLLREANLTLQYK